LTDSNAVEMYTFLQQEYQVSGVSSLKAHYSFFCVCMCRIEEFVIFKVRVFL